MSCIERVKKAGGSSAVKKSHKGICEIINPTPGLVYPTVDIREDIDMHFSFARDFHTIDRSTRACFDVDGIVPEVDDANDVVSTTVDANDVVRATIDVSEVRGCPSWMMAGNEQGAETIHAVNHSFAMEDVNFVDTMAPQDVIAEIGTDSAREMWIGRQFPD
ncbi:hypothetical protein MRB53_034637 [Persea americana]|uniref:Uncharacterized protein n=1 Tax=Persea americana TaxID=3435 RepID=A0ACC2K2E2_PERAE|nr:hypothetical protein MRB53_034637 [Persea americana]